MLENELIVFYIDDFQRQSYWPNYILGRPDYKNYGGYDRKNVYYPAVLQGRHDYIVNYALEKGLFDKYRFVLVVDGKSDISNQKIDEIFGDLNKTGADMMVPLSNYGREIQTKAMQNQFSEYAYLHLDCFLIRTEILKKINGFERKFCHVTFPEMYLDTYYTTLPNYDMSFCLNLWQNGYKIVLNEKLKITFAEKEQRIYSPIQESGGKDAIWYYHHLLVDDVKNCGEGLENIGVLLKEKVVHDFPEPEIDIGVFSTDENKKLILIVLPLLMAHGKAGISLENCLSITNIYGLFFKELSKKGYVVKPIQYDLLEQAKAILFMWDSGDIFFVSHRVYENLYVEKWKKIVCKTNNQKKAILCVSSEPAFVTPNHYKKESHQEFLFCLTGNQDWIDNQKYFYQPGIIDFYFNFKKRYDFKDKKLCGFAGGGFFRELRDKRCLYPERLALITYFDQYHSDEFEFYGARWSKEKFKSYRGFADDRIETLAKFKFVISIPNYIHKSTEFFDPRIFDAMVAGSVPIYFGCPDIKDVVPEGTFIDLRDFPSCDDLYNFISTMDEADYNTYLMNIEKFLKSDQAKKYSIENYTDCLVKVIEYIK
ncbi:glycosyltransferase family 10 domain-containing protein [Anaerosinus massiliensis]|uniref:glycosyltransferase family 10 domain-containing protein n=1 Tax=Massilibacillus massiliensis TaxID=1806837 RepID=UPI0018FE6D07|nr:glycosyltransferase family 10 [Massilibacillus massiliensis]